MTPTSGGGAPRPTARQLTYMRALAQRAGQTFTWPRTRIQASREIRRLKGVTPSSAIERELERVDWPAEAAAREANCDVPIRADELQGYGSSATWRRRP
jgi:hypothetical protein